MPRYIHCRICGRRSPKRYGFSKRMKWLRSHRKRKHPSAHRRSVRKAVRTRRRR